MKLSILSPAKCLSKAYLKQSLRREQIELFQTNLAHLFERIRVDEHEEHLKNIVSDFLKDTWYKQSNEINTSGRADLAIHNGSTSADSVGVLIEVKRPGNKSEMISPERPNAKALHELLHYYMQERYIKDNREIRHLIVCNIYEWYIFDAADFESFFLCNQKLVKSYKEWKEGTLPGMGTEWFYREIARPFIENELDELPCTWFDLREYAGAKQVSSALPVFDTRGNKGEAGEFFASPLQNDKKLIALYKLLSPPHLLKQSFANDSNSLNREFYTELLHIIGLEEVKEKGKKLIRRKAEGKRYDGSLLENTINVLKIRNKVGGDAAFDVGLELCITWLNRLLFLKLLEGQLISYHRGDRSNAFLNSGCIQDFDELNELFFEVLAARVDERSNSVKSKFGAIPYLNSSLFEESDLERSTMRINELKNRLDLPLHSATVLKDSTGKRMSGSKNTLNYLFEFLDAFDFATEGNPEIKEQNKSIINASVLGLIFEKINGYQDGSFFTPGFITMYICRETIRRAVVDKFNTIYGWNCRTVIDIYNTLDRIDIKEANATVNSLKICDPAVGSGHFLVSALNEIIAVKADLGILADREGKRLRGYAMTIENDELIVTVDEQIFEYNFKDPESRRIQETLFHEKETIIEQCLFGVDINPKSVLICRLRLWIELLKSAYYTKESSFIELETLPNIDINIKCGNSLVSRFAITGSANVYPTERYKLKIITDRYKDKVRQYKQAPANKQILRKEIAELKDALQGFAVPTDPDLIALRKIKNNLDQLGLGMVSEELERYRALVAQEEQLKHAIADKQKSVYANAFEWRYEFPEVLDVEGEFTGFDLIIGNPPYIRQEAIKDQKPMFMQVFGSFFCGTADMYTYFYKTGLNLLKNDAILCYIAPNKFMRAGYGKNTRELLTTQATPVMVLDFGDLPIFDEATTYPAIVMVTKKGERHVSTTTPVSGRKRGTSKAGKVSVPHPEPTFFAATFTNADQLTQFDAALAMIGFTMPVAALRPEGWALERPDVLALMDKLRKVGKPLGEYVEGKFYRGVLTGLNEAFVIDEETKTRLIAEDPKSAEIIKPWLRGRDIKKWQAEWAGLYVLFTRRGTDIDKYPAIKKHLEQFRENLEPKQTGNEEHGRKPGSYKWFDIQDNIAYFEEFEKEKILWPGITSEIVFGLGDKRMFGNDNNQLIISSDRSLLAILNSRIISFMLQQICDKVRGGFYRMKMIYVEQLPIPPATDAQKAAIIERVEKILAAKKSPPAPLPEGGSETTNIVDLEAEIDQLVYALYGLTEEEIALVEGRR